LQLNRELVERGCKDTSLRSLGKELDGFVRRRMRPIEKTLEFGVSFVLAVCPIKEKLPHREYEISETFVCQTGSGQHLLRKIVSDQRNGVRSMLAYDNGRPTEPGDVSTCKILFWEVVYSDKEATGALA
jgi:hypothetical protein